MSLPKEDKCPRCGKDWEDKAHYDAQVCSCSIKSQMKLLSSEEAWRVYNATPGPITTKLRAVQKKVLQRNGIGTP